MRSAALWLVAMMALFAAGPGGLAARAEPGSLAVVAVVHGNKIQKVGFRAMVQRLAIERNLAGSVRNAPNGTVDVRLQGRAERVQQVLDALRSGTVKSSRDNDVRQSRVDPVVGLDTFTLYGWTSVSRGIDTPYDLVFRLRPDDSDVSRKTAKKIWNQIALSTLQGPDLARFRQRLEQRE